MRKRKVRTFSSIFADHIANFIDLKRRMGYHIRTYVVILFGLDSYLSEMDYQGSLTEELAMNFVTSNPRLSKSWSARKYQIVQQFSVYLSDILPDTNPLPARREPRSSDRTLHSIFANHLVNFIEMKKQMGYQFEQQSSILLHFDRYLCELNYQGHLTQELALNFATSNLQMSKNGCAQKYQVVRQFSDYLAVFIPDTPLLRSDVLKRSKAHAPAHIYSDEEMTRLMNGARRVSPVNPLRNVTLHAIVGLTASAGLRISEVVTLDRDDVNLETGILTVRRSKFQKNRLVPVHPTTLDVLRDYVLLRDACFPCPATPAFFSMRNKRFSRHTLRNWFYRLACEVGVRKSIDHGPRFHDLRHTFAVRRLVAWYREGKDVQAMLPFLATYMGHVHYRDTSYYLTATAELLGLAAEKYDAFLKKEVK